jgi:hypothetical protein
MLKRPQNQKNILGNVIRYTIDHTKKSKELPMEN